MNLDGRELSRRINNWRKTGIGKMYAKCQSPPPVVIQVIEENYILDLEAELRSLRKQVESGGERQS